MSFGAKMKAKLVGDAQTKGLTQRSGIVATGGGSAIVALQPLVEMVTADPRLQTSLVTLGTLLISALLTTFGNNSRR
jgi:hypothetical protein